MLTSALFLFGLTVFAQKCPSMKGYWYSPTTQEMFVISTDADNSIKGRGVYYSSGGGSFKQMQILTQTPKKAEDNTDVYFLSTCDLKKPNRAWDITSTTENGAVVLSVTVKGDKTGTSKFYNLKNMKP